MSRLAHKIGAGNHRNAGIVDMAIKQVFAEREKVRVRQTVIFEDNSLLFVLEEPSNRPAACILAA
jgi:hypothetical protein